MKTHSSIFITALGILGMCLVLSCVAESSKRIRKKLDAVVTHDLNSLVAQLPDTSVIDSPYYSIVSYEYFKEGDYIAKGVVDFFVIKKAQAKVRRKYRYERFRGKWERYYNRWEYYSVTPE